MNARLMLCLALGASLAAHAAVQTDIEYGNPGGTSLRLDASVPDGPGPFPAVILVHGGGWTAGDKEGGPNHSLIAPMEEPLARAGFAWFSINYRLAPAYPYPACVDDLETAIRWVKAHAKEYRVDPNRLALAGESAGGHLVAFLGVRAGDASRVAAVVVFYGPTDLVADTERRGGLSASMKALFHLETMDDTARAVLHDASPVNYVRPGLPPFLLVHGTADQSVLYQQSVIFRALLQSAQVPCDLITIPNGVHGMHNWSKIAPDYQAQVVAWLERALRPKT